MEFIGNRADIEREPFVKAVFDILDHVINDDNSYLYYKYPFYKYIWIVKPILVSLFPKSIIFKLHKCFLK